MQIMAVLLLGSTGNGKSALGNFLLDPDDPCAYFEVSTNLQSTTQETKAATAEVTFQEVDTIESQTPPNSRGATCADNEISPESSNGQQIDHEDATPKHEVFQGNENTLGDVSADEEPQTPSQSSFRLLNPSSWFKRTVRKKTDNGAGSKPSTSQNAIIEGNFKVKFRTVKKSLTVIDTPGLNEITEKKELQHMIDIIKSLDQHKTLRACIFVVKFEATIDQQYISTIDYYSRLLPSLFSRNCIIVQTHYKTDQLSEEDRSDRGLDEDEITEVVRKKIMEHSCMKSEPIIFKLDCRPNRRYSIPLQNSLEERNSILSKIFSHRPFDINIMEVAKSRSMLTRHEERIASYKEEIKHYNEVLKKAHQSKSDALDEAQKNENEITERTADIEMKKQRLEIMSTDELVPVEEWVIEKRFKFLQWQEAPFQLESKCEIVNVRHWTNGHSKLEYKDIEQKLVTGTIKGHFMRGLYANVTLEAKKKDSYAEEISVLQKAIRKEEKLCEEVRYQTQKKMKEADETITALQKFNEERRTQIAELSLAYMTIKEAELELEALKASSNS